MQLYVNFIDKINKVLKFVVSSMFIVLVALVFLQVVTRFVINYPLSWSEEIARYIMVYLVFLGSAVAVRKGEHIAIDFLVEIVSAKNKKRLMMLILSISSIFFAVLCYNGILLTALVAGEATPTLQFSMSWAYAAMPIGSLLMLLNAIAVLIEIKNRPVEEIPTGGDIL
ncbi:TRAP transporter small permease [Niallia sp. FSL W8-0635]|uniref:TRAP transporter small permease n=1 Tax=Niallia sp. FSL W8-0635 TaxID=2975337 RepID=UPI0009C9540F|nr:tripartite AtP-independent periplasmic transporter subunit DctQ [Mycobacteroides abscessus subsp. abscessus]HEO8419660.1 TRAP transporter small permease [Yersinia enterocolitica]